MKKLSLNENFICRIWENKSYYSGLKTSSGEQQQQQIEVIEYGIRNYDSGPDYKHAKVKIGEIIYSGSIEIHRSLNDWYLHNHDGDNKYNELILHVVFYGEENSGSGNVKVKKARAIPTVILSEFLTRSIHEIWREIIESPSQKFRLPCFPQNRNVAHSCKTQWLSNLSRQRLIYKSDRINSRLKEITDDNSKKIYWEQVLFEFICEALGYSKNKVQFLKLAKNIEIIKIKENNFSQLEFDSVLFGLSGFLKDLKFKDEYITELKSCLPAIKDKLKKEIMDKSEWHFFRLRPPNFPTLRLAYASALLLELVYNGFFKTIIKIFEESENVSKDLLKKFIDINVSGYWKTHYNFGKESRRENINIGKERIRDIIANVVLPVVYLYSVNFQKENLRKRTEHFYKKEKQKSCANEVTRVMEKQLEVKTNSLADEQALIHLHNFYCVKGKCNECEIGKLIFESGLTGGEVHEPLKIILY